jgi:hypothetical protein
LTITRARQLAGASSLEPHGFALSRAATGCLDLASRARADLDVVAGIQARMCETWREKERGDDGEGGESKVTDHELILLVRVAHVRRGK